MPRRGWNAGYPVLKPDQVRAIRVRLAKGASKYRLGKDYGVTADAITKIERGISHKGVV